MIETLEPRRLLCGAHYYEAPAAMAPLAATTFSARFNFQPESNTTVPAGFRADVGRAFGKRANGLSYGWSTSNEQWMRTRNGGSDQRLQTLAHFAGRSWELAIPNGTYDVTIAAGDSDYIDSRYRIDAEGVRMFNFTPTSSNRFVQATQVVTVKDGRLTITSAPGAINNKINYIEIAPHEPSSWPSEQLNWSTGPAAPIARSEAQQAVYGGKLYVFGGFVNENFQATTRADVFDPSTNKWTRLADLPEALTHAATVADGKNILLIGGYVGDHPAPATRSVWKYDTRKNRYEALPPLPAPRGAGAAAILGTNLHFFGGQLRDANGNTVRDSANHWMLDLTNIDAGWQAKRSLPNPRNHLAGVTAGGRIFAIGGQTMEDEYHQNQSDVHVYNPHTDRWWQAASLPQGIGHINMSTFEHHERIFVVGGAVNVNGSKMNEADKLYSYDIYTNSWSTIGSLPAPRKSPLANAVDDELLVIGGSVPYPTDQTWRTSLAG